MEYRVREEIAPEQLNALISASWEKPWTGDWSSILARSLTWITAYRDGSLVGFVHVAWDGGAHAFLLDPTVHPSMRRTGIGTELVRMAARSARDSGVEWLHVDYEPHLEPFYAACGFGPTQAGLIRLAGM
ncbi:MAG TPA: GNAT family N-acetyltransferase [Candidatus Eisenbacteria bacterium]|nr:GNAT family N-acetyltransferase [Candidatus Eisenbacteria bacterium]